MRPIFSFDEGDDVVDCEASARTFSISPAMLYGSSFFVLEKKMSERPTRACALCLKVRCLCDSHFLPRALYRYLRAGDRDSSNPNPVFMSDTFDGQLSNQASDYLLCEECEARFRKNGETWVLAHCYRGPDRFKLHELLRGREPAAKTERFAGYCAGIPGIDLGKLVYFAASIFWRSAIHPWCLGRHSLFQICLGTYEESFRRYLMGEDEFPANAVLSVTVAERKDSLPVAHFPVSKNNGLYHHHWFRIPGVAFHLFVGTAIDGGLRSGCSARSQIIYVSDIIDEKIVEDLQLAATVRARKR